MGNCCHRCGGGRKTSKRKIVLLLVGLDNAGKTTAAKSLIGEPQDGIVPTVGFSTMTLNYKHWSVTIYDVGGGQQIRGIWPQYFVDVHGIIFVVDASDVSRLEEGQKVLEQLLGHEKLSGKPMLLLANKQDCKEALDELDIVEQLNVEALVNFHRCPTLVETCSALRDKSSQQKVDPAIHNGFKWLINCINKDYEQLNKRVEIDTREQGILDEQKRKERLERIRKAREERGEEAVPYQANAEEDSDSADVVTSDPFRPISEVMASMHGLDGTKKAVVEPALSDSRIILVKESPGGDAEEKESLTPQERVSHIHNGSGDSSTENVTQMVKDQLQLDALPHRKHIPLLPHRNNRTAPAPVFENVPLKDIATIEAMFEIKKEDGLVHKKEAFAEEKYVSGKTNLERQHSVSDANTVDQNADRKHSSALLKEVIPPSLCNATVNESKGLCMPLDISVGEGENMEANIHECISLPVSRKGREQEKEGNTRRVVSAKVPHCNKLERTKVFSGKSSLDESSLSSENKISFNDSGFASPWKILPPLRPPSSGDTPRWICPTLSSIPQRPSSPGSEVVRERRDQVFLLDENINATKNSDIFT